MQKVFLLSPVVASCYFPRHPDQQFVSSCLVTTPWSILVVLYSVYSHKKSIIVLFPLFLSQSDHQQGQGFRTF